MKLYKIDFANYTNIDAPYKITVPTDSQFLIGLSNGDADATVVLKDANGASLTAETSKIGAYTAFRFSTTGTPSKSKYEGTISGGTGATAYVQKIALLVVVDKMTVAYIDKEGISAAEAVEAVEDSGKFLEKDDDGAYTLDADVIFQSGDETIATMGPDGGNLLVTGDINASQATIYGCNVSGDINASGATISDATLADPVIQIENQEYGTVELEINGATYSVIARLVV